VIDMLPALENAGEITGRAVLTRNSLRQVRCFAPLTGSIWLLGIGPAVSALVEDWHELNSLERIARAVRRSTS
jgi:hypothetical protein